MADQIRTGTVTATTHAQVVAAASGAAAALPDFMTTAEYAAVVRAPQSTVRYWRHVGKGPCGRRIGKRILYDRSEILAYLASLDDDRQPESAA